LKLCSDDVESELEVVRDVLAEEKISAALFDDARDMGPEVSGVLGRSLLASDGEWLTRVACSDEIHDSTPRLAVERSNVIPDRRRIQ